MGLVLVVLAIVVVALIVGVAFILPHIKASGGGDDEATNDGVVGYVYAGKSIMTVTEREFHNRLLAAFVGQGVEVWPQVSMLALLEPVSGPLSKAKMKSKKEGNGRGDNGKLGATGKIQALRVDWVLGRDGQPFAVIELDDASHKTKKDKDDQRDQFLAQVGLRTYRFKTESKPDAELIRSLILGSGEAAMHAAPEVTPAQKIASRRYSKSVDGLRATREVEAKTSAAPPAVGSAE